MKKNNLNKLIATIAFSAILISGLFLYGYLGIIKESEVFEYSVAVTLLIGISIFAGIIYLKYILIINNLDKCIDREIKLLIQESKHEKIKTSQQKTENVKNVDETLQLNIDAIIPQRDMYKNLKEFCDTFLSNLSKQTDLVRGIFYIENEQTHKYTPRGTYAFYSTSPISEIEKGDGLVGQAILDKKILYLNEIPEKYFNVISGLGEGSPKYLLILPLLENDHVFGVIEMASFNPLIFNFEEFNTSVSEKIVNLIKNLS